MANESQLKWRGWRGANRRSVMSQLINGGGVMKIMAKNNQHRKCENNNMRNISYHGNIS
jgi:hypothetical protein